MGKQKLQKWSFYVLTLLVLTYLNGCKSLQTDLSKAVKTPEVSIEKMAVSGVSLDTVDLVLALKVKNPNTYNLALAGYDYKVKLNDLDLIKGQTSQRFQISAKGSDIIQVPLSISFNDVVELYKGLGDKNSIKYDADVGLKLDAPILNLFRLPAAKQGEITIPRMPKVSFSDIQVRKLSFTEIDLSLDMLVDNPNDFALNIKDILYNINVGGNSWVKGGIDKALAIKKNQTSSLTIPFKMSLSDLGSGMLNALRKGNFEDFAVDASFTVDSDHKAFQNLKVPINYKP